MDNLSSSMSCEKFHLNLDPHEVVIVLCALVLISCCPDFNESEVPISALISELSLQAYKNSIK